MKNLFQNRAVGFWLDLAGTVLTLVGIILYALYAADTGSNNVWVYIGLVAAVAAGAAGLVTDNDLLAIAAPALSAVSLCAFITDSVYTFVGYFFGLAMFGDVSKIGAIMRICVVVAISMLALLISSFMRKDYRAFWQRRCRAAHRAAARRFGAQPPLAAALGAEIRRSGA